MVGQNMKEAEDISPFGLTQMALDVAYGLQYLSELKYVHRFVLDLYHVPVKSKKCKWFPLPGLSATASSVEGGHSLTFLDHSANSERTPAQVVALKHVATPITSCTAIFINNQNT